MTDLTTARNLIYLSSCAFHGLAPDEELVRKMDMAALFRAAGSHKLAALVSYSFEKMNSSAVDIMGEQQWDKWKQIKNKAVRRAVLFDSERERHLSFFEQQGIRYLPLKGILIKDYYPQYGLREMADNDILYDSRFREELRDYMISQGYTPESVGLGPHDSYTKMPVFNFEFHSYLFSKTFQDGLLINYYSDPFAIAVKDADNGFGYHFSADDCYVYVSAHAFKHYENAGTGLRTIVDNYAFRTAKKDELHFDYIDKELAALGLLEFDLTLRSLADHLMEVPGAGYDMPGAESGRNDAGTSKTQSQVITTLPEKEQKMFAYMADAGVYGKLENRVRHNLRKAQNDDEPISLFTKTKYILQRIFPSIDHMRHYSTVSMKYPVTIPVMYVYRWFRAAFKRRNAVKAELDAVKKNSGDPR